MFVVCLRPTVGSAETSGFQGKERNQRSNPREKRRRDSRRIIAKWCHRTQRQCQLSGGMSSVQQGREFSYERAWRGVHQLWQIKGHRRDYPEQFSWVCWSRNSRLRLGSEKAETENTDYSLVKLDKQTSGSFFFFKPQSIVRNKFYIVIHTCLSTPISIVFFRVCDMITTFYMCHAFYFLFYIISLKKKKCSPQPTKWIL